MTLDLPSIIVLPGGARLDIVEMTPRHTADATPAFAMRASIAIIISPLAPFSSLKRPLEKLTPFC